MRLTHLYINIISEAHSYLRTMSARLSHTWVITARLTHSYMYAGYSYRLGGGGGSGAHSHLYTTSVRLTHTWAVIKLWKAHLWIYYNSRLRYWDLSICACCRFLYGLGQGLGAGSGIRGWVRVRANMYLYMWRFKRRGLWLQLSFLSWLDTLW